jgi:ABC-type branched-subunit amino acid transport system ATPase component
MIRTFIVKNFRCFTSLRVGTPKEPLARVNLIAGKNNSGKTALLEAIHLHCNPGNSQVPFRINDFRDFGKLQPYAPDLASWLFHERQHSVNTSVETISYDEKNMERSVTMKFVTATEMRQSYPGLDRELQDAFRPDIWQADTPRLILRLRQLTDSFHSLAIVSDFGGQIGSGLSSLNGKFPVETPSTYLGSQAPTQDTVLFSEMEVANRQNELLPSLRLLEPRLQRLSLALLNGEPVIHGDVGLSRLVPFPVMGEGLRRLFSILLTLALTRNGVVLIDEIENGLHHSVLRDVWRAVGDVAQRENVQVFATTHSYECIQAAHEAFEPHSDEAFRLLRLDREGDEIRVVPWFRRNIETALEMNMEMR